MQTGTGPRPASPQPKNDHPASQQYGQDHKNDQIRVQQSEDQAGIRIRTGRQHDEGGDCEYGARDCKRPGHPLPDARAGQEPPEVRPKGESCRS